MLSSGLGEGPDHHDLGEERAINTELTVGDSVPNRAACDSDER